MNETLRVWTGIGLTAVAAALMVPAVEIGCTVNSPQGVTACERACDNMERLCAEGGASGCVDACEAAAPDEEGASCEDVCSNAEQSKIISLNPDCRARANSCAEITSQCD